MSTSDKLTYLSGTKDKLKTTINYTGANITNDTFRSYPEKLYNKYIDIINNGTGTLYNNMPKVSGQGDSITLNNTESAPMLLSLYGETQQDSTTGKNLLPLPISNTKNGIQLTTNSDGSFTLNGTATTNSTYRTYNLSESKTLSAGTYTLYYNVSKLNSDNALNLQIRTSANTNLFSKDLTSVGSGTKLITLSESTTIVSFRTWFNVNDSINNSNIQLMLVSGSTAGDFEPYTNGPSPNPDYPQEIHNVSGDNTIEICGKNFISNIAKTGNILYFNGATKYEDYVFKAGTYTFSYKDTNNRSLNIKDASGTQTGLGTGKTITFTSNYDFNVWLYGSGITLEEVSEVQLEKGSTATDYEAYQGNSQLISLGVENLLNLTDGTYTATDITGVVNNGVITLNGTASATRFLDVSLGTNLSYVNAQNYTVSLNNQSTNGSVNLRIDGSGTFDTIANDKNKTKTFTYDGTTMFTNKITIRVTSGTTLTDFVIKPQMEKGSKANSYSEYGKPYIELNQISTYQDYIYKDNDRWYLHKEIGKWLFDNNSGWSYNSANTIFLNNASVVSGKYLVQSAYCNYYKNVINENITGNSQANSILNNNEFSFRVGTQDRMYIKDTRFTSIEDFNTWLSTNNLIVYYVLATPTDTEITDTTLLEQLNNLEQIKSKKDQTNINQENNDLPFIITASALKEYE